MESMKWVLGFYFLFTMTAWAGPVGFYTDGSLTDAECLPTHGEGFMQLYRDVNHIFATRPLLNMIVEAASDLNEKYPNRDRLQVEEMSAREGGDIEGHASHENGLDVDIQFFKRDGVEHVPTAQQYYAPSMVVGGAVSPNFDVERNWELMKALHRHGDVQRIFIDTKLKAALCSYARSTGDYNSNIKVLRSLQHQTNHQDHIHVRLRCPPNTPRCTPQADPPAGSGCP